MKNGLQNIYSVKDTWGYGELLRVKGRLLFEILGSILHLDPFSKKEFTIYFTNVLYHS